ncbi:hypothetical protein LINPERHAP2_LOCUS21567 [Linum perenne]
MEETIAAREAPPAEIPIPVAVPAPISDTFNAAAEVAAAAAAPPPVPTVPQPAAAPPPRPNFYGNSRKRGHENDSRTRDCNYPKIRAVVRDIRPHLLEVIRTADFRSCKGAHDIRERVKLVMELCKQLAAETGGNAKSRFAAEGPQHQFSSENGGGQKYGKSSDIRGYLTELPMVGASAFGWNFITYPDSGGRPVYYGRTKASFRAAQGAVAAAL